MTVLISCEVGGTEFPAIWASATATNQRSTRSKVDSNDAPAETAHAISTSAPQFDDPAALEIAERWSAMLSAPLIANPFSPHLIDVSRSLHHRSLFPAATRSWPEKQREQLIQQIHHPYRERIRGAITSLLQQAAYVIHLSIRSFEPRHGGKHRRADVGLLYDPSRDDEVDFCLDWIDEMYDQMPMLRVRRNYPRRGTTDSITKAMRAEFANQPYLGVEVLLNRAWVRRPLKIRDHVINRMCQCLHEVTSFAQADAA